MTVKQLIAALQSMPSDAVVVLSVEVGYSTVVSVEHGYYAPTEEGKQGSWFGPFESCSGDDAEAFEGVQLCQ